MERVRKALKSKAAALGVSALVVLWICVSAAPAVPADPTANGTPSAPPGTDGPPAAVVAAAEAERDAAERAAAGSAGRAERAESRDAFADQGAAEVLSDLRHGDEPLTDTEAWSPLTAGGSIRSFLSDRSARLDRGGIVLSNIPLRARDDSGRMAPIDMRLDEGRTGWMPENALVDTTLPAVASGPTAVGDVAVRFTDAVAAAGIELDGRVVYPNAMEDVDLGLVPQPTGVESFLRVRSPEAPETFGMSVSASSGEIVGTPEGGLAIRRAGDVVAGMTPPSAVDAQGRSVPVSLEVAPDGAVVMTMRHRSADVAYPVTIDPWIAKYDWAGTGTTSQTGWGKYQSRTGSRWCNDLFGWYQGVGFYTYTRNDPREDCYQTSYAAGELLENNYYGEWYPRGGSAYGPESYIYGFVRKVNVDPGASGICRYSGIFTTQSNRWVDPLSDQRTTPIINCEADGGLVQISSCTNATNDGLCNYNTPSQANGRVNSYAVLGTRMGPAGPKTYFTNFSGYAAIYVADDNRPNIVASGFPTGWTRDVTLRATATDTGLGVASASLSSGTWSSPPLRTCSVEPATHCQPSQTVEAPTAPADGKPKLAEGINTIAGTVADPQNTDTGTLAPHNFTNAALGTVQLDRTSPNVTVDSGSMPTIAAQRAGKTVFKPIVSATDGETTSNATRRSGVKRVDLSVDGTVNPVSRPSDSSCSNSCPVSVTDYTIDTTKLSVGTHSLQVVVPDRAGNPATTKTVSFEVVDPTPPTLRAYGPLRQKLVVAGTDQRTLYVDASDAHSGLTQVAVHLDPPATGSPTAPPVAQATSCSASPCITYRLPESASIGKHSMLVRAKDAAGNVSEDRWTFVVAAPGSDRSWLGLERWWAFDSDETGAGSQLHVNGWNGNAVWQTGLIDNPGRGLDTTLSLTYNSREDQGGLASEVLPSDLAELSSDIQASLGSGYNEVGAGFSLGFDVSRINEPLRGVDTASPATVWLTDADGTEHAFTRDGAGNYVEPPGVNLRLRRLEMATTTRAWSMTKPDGTVRYFSEGGFETAVVDRRGNTVALEYERYSKLTGGRSSCDQTSPLSAPSAADLALLCRPRVTRIVDAAGVDALNASPAAPAVADRRSVKLAYANTPLLSVNTTAAIDAAKATIGRLSPDQQRRVLSFGGAAGRISTLTDHAGRVTEFRYTDGYLTRLAQGDVGTNTDSHREFGFDYESNGAPRRMTRVVDPQLLANGATPAAAAGTRLTYGATACSGLTDPEAAQRVASRIDRAGRTSTFCFGVNGSVTRFATSDPSATGAAAAVTTRELDARGRPTSVTDPLYRRTTMQWDDETTKDNNVVTSTVRPGTSEEAITSWTYDRNGQARTRIDPLGHVTTYDYCYSQTSAARICTDQTSADPGTREIADLSKVTRPEGDFVLYERNAYGEPTARTYSDETVPMRWDYDSRGQMTFEKDEMLRQTDFEAYDESGLPQRIADGRATAAAAGSVARSRRWVVEYDAVGNPRKQTDPRGATVSADAAAAPTIDPKYTTTTTFDALDRAVQVVTPRGDGTAVTRTTAYDDNGNVTATTDGNGKPTTYGWTRTDQIKTAATPPVAHAGASSAAAETTVWSYDPHDNVSKVETPNGAATTGTADDWSTAYAYDNADQLLTEIRKSVVGTTIDQQITSYAYDGRGNVVGMADPKANATGVAAANAAPNGNRRWQWDYDAADRQIAAVEAPDTAELKLRTERDYDDNDRVEVVRPPRYWEVPEAAARSKFLTTFAYTARDDRKTVTQGDRVTRYDYYADGQLDTIRSPRASSASDTRFVTKLTYDTAGDVASRKLPSAGLAHEGAAVAMTYTRDAAGDPVTVTDYRGNPATNTFFASGELKSTTRPWMWDVGPTPDAERDGQEVTERSWEDWRRGAASGAASDLPSGDFGAARRRGLPPLEPRAGQTTFGYDGDMRLQSITDAAGRVTSLARDDVGRVASITRPLRADRGGSLSTLTTAYQYDPDGNRLSTTDAEGFKTTTTFDQFGRRVQQDAPGAARSIQSDGTPAAESQEVTQWGYDANDNVTSVKAPTGATTELKFDRVDRRIATQAPEGRTTTYGYDAAGNVTCERAPRGNAASSQTCATGDYTEVSTFDAYDELKTRTIDPDVGDNLDWTFEYDADGNRTELTAPGSQREATGSILPRITRMRYDGRGLLWSETTDSGRGQGVEDKRTTVTEYDPNGNLRRTVNPRGIDRTADPAKPTLDDPTQTGSPSIDASTNATVNHYDTDNLAIETWLPSSGSSGDVEDKKRYRIDRSYDARGRIRSITRAYENGGSAPRQASYGYLETGWIACTSRTAGVEGDCDNAPSATGLGNRQPGEVRYEYDRRGLQTSWLAGGRESERTYYGNGLLKQREARVDAADQRKRSYRYAWTSNGDLGQILDVQESRRWNVARDTADRVLEVNETGAGDRDTAFTYDVGDNVRTRKTDGVFTGAGTARTYANGKTTTFDYDSLDRETRATVDPQTGADRVTKTTWWPSGDRKTRRRFNDSTETAASNVVDRWLFDANGDAAAHQRYTGSDTAEAFRKNQTYTYDRNGNRTRDEQGESEFNSRDQLVKNVDRDNSGVPTTTATTYTLDGNGALQRKKVDINGLATISTYSYDRDRLKCIAVYSTEPSAGASTCPDDESAGLPVGQLGWTRNVHNALGQVTETRTKFTSDPVETARYGYDAFGRLTGQQKKAGAKITRYAHDGLDRREIKCSADASRFNGSVVDEPPLDRSCPEGNANRSSYIGLSELVTSEQQSEKTGSATTPGERRFYDYDATNQRLGQDRVPTAGAGTFRAFSTDARGSVETLEDPTGARVGGYRYDPYGTARLSGANDADQTDTAAAAANPFRFEGFYADDGLGTYDMQARPYDPAQSRFLAEDEYEDADADLSLESNPLTQDRYAFAGGNPTGNIEADGHEAPCDGACQRAIAEARKAGPRSKSGTPSKRKATTEPTTNIDEPAVTSYVEGANEGAPAQTVRVGATDYRRDRYGRYIPQNRATELLRDGGPTPNGYDFVGGKQAGPDFPDNATVLYHPECGQPCRKLFGGDPASAAANLVPIVKGPRFAYQGVRVGLRVLARSFRTARTSGRTIREGRRAYIAEAEAIRNRGIQQLERGADPYTAAKEAVDARNALKLRVRDALPSPFRKAAEAYSQRTYGNPVGPTVDDYLADRRTPREIIQGAGKTNSKLNSLLGLP